MDCFLASCKLANYTSALEYAGYDDLEFLQTRTEDQLLAIGKVVSMPIGHAQRFAYAVKKSVPATKTPANPTAAKPPSVSKSISNPPTCESAITVHASHSMEINFDSLSVDELTQRCEEARHTYENLSHTYTKTFQKLIQHNYDLCDGDVTREYMENLRSMIDDARSALETATREKEIRSKIVKCKESFSRPVPTKPKHMYRSGFEFWPWKGVKPEKIDEGFPTTWSEMSSGRRDRVIAIGNGYGTGKTEFALSGA